MSVVLSVSPDLTDVIFVNPQSSTTPTQTITWVNINANTVATAFYGYFINQGSSRVVLTMPISPANGTIVIAECVAPANPPSAPGVTIACVAGQSLSMAGVVKPVGASLTSTFQGACITLVYNAQNATWIGSNIVGTFS